MQKLNRRTLMAAGTTLAAGGLFGTTSAVADEHNGDNEESGESGDADFARPDGVAWRYDGPFTSRWMAVEGDRLYTVSDGSVYAIDTADGSLVWETGDVGADRAPTVEGGTVYVAGEPVQAIDAETGDVRWKSEFESIEMAVGHGMVYTSEDGTVYALDAEDGSVVWERDEVTIERQTGEETEEATLEFLSVGDTDDDWIYVFDDDSWGRDVVGLDPTTGETGVVVGPMDGVSGVIANSGYLGVQPPFDSTYLIDISTNENIGGVHQSHSQAFSGDGYFTADKRGDLLAYDLSAGGELAWEMEYAKSYPKVIGNTAVVLFGPDYAMDPDEEEDEDRVVAYNFRTGEEQWRYVFDEREWTGDGMESIAIDDDTVYLERDDELLALRSEDSEDENGDEDDEEPAPFERPDGVAWRHDGPHDIDATVATGGRVYTLADGGVYALDAEDGSADWETGDVGAARTLSVEGDTVYTAGDPVQAIDAETGEIRWESDVSSQPIEPDGEFSSGFDTRDEEIAVGHGMIYASEGDTVYAIDAEDGSIAWERDEIVVVTDDGEVVAEELQMGDVSEDAVYVFEESFGDGGMFAELEPTTGEAVQTVETDEAVSHLVAGSGHVAVVPGYDSSHLYDMTTRQMVDASGPAYAHSIVDDTYFITMSSGFVRTYDLSVDATHLWDSDEPWRHGSPVLAGRTVIAPFGPEFDPDDDRIEDDDEDGLTAFDRDSGEETWEYTFDELEWSRRDATIETDEDTVYVSRGGELLALRSGVEDDGLELSVSAPESAPYEEEVDPAEDAVDFEVSVTNHGDESVSADVTLEIGPIDEPTTLELAPGEHDVAHYGVMTRDLGVGDHEWTVTADGETETGTLTVTDEGDDEDRSLELSVSAPDSIGRGESASVDVTIWNHGEEDAEVPISLEVGDHTDSSTVEIAAGDCYASFHSVWCGDLSVGDNEWTVTAAEETESGTITLTDG